AEDRAVVRETPHPRRVGVGVNAAVEQAHDELLEQVERRKRGVLAVNPHLECLGRDALQVDGGARLADAEPRQDAERREADVGGHGGGLGDARLPGMLDAVTDELVGDQVAELAHGCPNIRRASSTTAWRLRSSVGTTIGNPISPVDCTTVPYFIN